MLCRGIRGATVAAANTKEEITSATQELLRKMLAANYVDKQAVACMFFTTTPDLNAEFPALAARQMGWTDTALMCNQEIAVPGNLENASGFWCCSIRRSGRRISGTCTSMGLKC